MSIGAHDVGINTDVPLWMPSTDGTSLARCLHPQGRRASSRHAAQDLLPNVCDWAFDTRRRND